MQQKSVLQGTTNHFGLVIDESSSMRRHAGTVEQVVDSQVRHWAERSQHWQQETRVSVYVFNSFGTARCLIWDMDVLRVPSIQGLYHPQGMTALIDTVRLALTDLDQIPTMYGSHANVLYAVTDGQNNDSRTLPSELERMIINRQANTTVAAFVPDQRGLLDAQKAGFPRGNVEVWNPNSATGFEEIGARLREVSETIFAGRAEGRTSFRGLLQVNDVSAAQVHGHLDPLPLGSYSLFSVDRDAPIRSFVEARTGRYVTGRAYYQLTRPVQVQDYKGVVIEANGRLYTGEAARALLGLPAYNVKIEPSFHQSCTVFIQSTSVNRKLLAGTRLLVLS
jgi:hypothetical protein